MAPGLAASTTSAPRSPAPTSPHAPHGVAKRARRLRAQALVVEVDVGAAVDKEDAAERRLDKLLRLDRRLARVARDERRAVALDKVAEAQEAAAGDAGCSGPREFAW